MEAWAARSVVRHTAPTRSVCSEMARVDGHAEHWHTAAAERLRQKVLPLKL